jgi:hypothetical protein|tara:strand:+ start:23 stop:610 length:588 start_codon:yes stop_codon:yes gene_type:complete
MDVKEFKKPNLKAPRFRPDVYQVMNQKFFNEFRKKHPRYKNLTDTQLRKIGKTFNIIFWEKVIENRDGVQLPEGLGYMFVGTCQASKKDNINYGKSHKYGIPVRNKNWETDGKLAKIFYTSYASKYKFVNRECWAFTACRSFKRSLSKSYPENWTMYVEVDPMKKLKKIFQRDTMKHKNTNKLDPTMENYNEFEL